MGELTETRWKKFSHDRVYLRTEDGIDVGYVDLKLGSVVTKDPEYQQQVEDCLTRWHELIGEVPVAAANEGSPEPASGADEPPVTARDSHRKSGRLCGTGQAQRGQCRTSGSQPGGPTAGRQDR